VIGGRRDDGDGRDGLRRAAEGWLSRLETADPADLSRDELQTMAHELRVHQIELAMQNEELWRARRDLEESYEVLARSERRHRRLYDFAPMGYVSFDDQGVIADANLEAARLLGVPRGELLGLPLARFVDPADQDRWFLARRAVAEGRGEPSYEVALRLEDGTSLHVRIDMEARPGDELVRASLVDVSARVRSERAIRQATLRELLAEQRERRSLAEQIHGDVEQTLAAAALRLQSLGDASPGATPDAADDGVGQVVRSLQDVAGRLASLGFRMSPSVLFDVGLAAAARSLAEDVEMREGLHLRAEESEDGDIEGLDEAGRIALWSVLRELVANTVRHSGTREATLRVWGGDGRAHLEVCDSGAGFDPERVDHGMGLVVAALRLEQLGGSLSVESHPGGGTRVVASLPLTDGRLTGGRDADRDAP